MWWLPWIIQLLFVAILFGESSIAFTVHTPTYYPANGAAIHVSSSSSSSYLSDQTTTRKQKKHKKIFQLEESQQAEYGKSLQVPDSYVKCGKCQTVYSLQESDFGEKARGRRLGCSVCGHTWFQSKDRLMKLRDGYELADLPEYDKERIALNIKEGKSPNFTGDSKLYVGNISFECHEDDLRNLFETVGQVGDVSLVRDDTGRNRGFGFVTMRNMEDGNKALEELNGSNLRGRNIAVRESTN